MFHIQFNQHSKLIKKPSSSQIKDHKAKEFIKILINKKKSQIHEGNKENQKTKLVKGRKNKNENN